MPSLQNRECFNPIFYHRLGIDLPVTCAQSIRMLQNLSGPFLIRLSKIWTLYNVWIWNTFRFWILITTRFLMELIYIPKFCPDGFLIWRSRIWRFWKYNLNLIKALQKPSFDVVSHTYGINMFLECSVPNVSETASRYFESLLVLESMYERVFTDS